MKVINLKSIDSTNEYIKRKANSLENLSFVFADFQTKGKGRTNREWLSEKKQNILFSILLKSKNLVDNYKIFSTGSAYCIAKILEDIGLKNVTIKWPNDIYVNGKKICGILLEGNVEKYIIIGIGLNVNQDEFSSDLRRPATSILKEKDSIQNIDLIKKKIVNSFVDFINNIDIKKTEINEFLSSHNFLKNKLIKVDGYEGIVVGLTSENELLLNTKEGIITIISGEIEIMEENL